MKNPGTPWRITLRPDAADTIDDCCGRILFVVAREAAEQAKHVVSLVNGVAGLRIRRAPDQHDKPIASPKELANSVCLDGARSTGEGHET